ncbi:putative bifunctional diguanylate cyclase/phosphodiesterase [Oceanobacter mangrovi]|uniref:putative bifunctional diguanylate cyclase/phosphodiesterase n=1 Tax=Oceanobacter mangrovi TaxID=2862510 RepID=UPI001C8E1708
MNNLRLETMHHLEQICDRWRSASEVVCLLGKQFDDSLRNTLERLRLKLPSAPLMVGLQDVGDEVQLLELGVQEVFALGRASPDARQLERLANITIARMDYELALRSLTHFDPLTGLANRSLFQDRLEQSLIQARRNSLNVGLLFIDVDRFRVVNDIYGHSLGDQLLLACSHRLQKSLRRSDTVARLGGNTFAVILDSVRGTEVVTAVAQKLADALKAPFKLESHEIFVTVSIGIEISCEANYDAGQMVRRAELALHQVKRDGRNDCQIYSPQSAPIDKIRVGLESALHHAMERDELRLVYQPQISVVGNHFVGAEVLLRWQHPVLGLVSPAVFIPVLEDTGLIEPFGEWVLRQACKQYKYWLDQKLVTANSKISVNLSPRQFRQRDLGERIQQILQETGLPTANLTLEITESTLMYNLEQGAAMLSELRALGVRVAIDDFGTGYSSLAYLKDLPIDFLKIDRSFVKDIVDDRNDAAIANSIIALAHNLGLQVIAEGVESSDILAALESFGCDHYQGFFFAKPVEAEDIPELVSRCA